MKDFKVAAAQYDLKLGDKKENLSRAEKFVSKAASKDVDFIVLPEYVSTGSVPERFKELAEPISGDTVTELLHMSEKNNIHIVASFIEEEDGQNYNTAILTDPKGELLAKYRKIHLFMDEKRYVKNGTEIVTAETEFGKVGLMICYDGVFPEVARRLAIEGVDMILVPANWPDPFEYQWQLALSARALDNQLWIAAANRIGADDKFTYFGKSRIVNPYGLPEIECGKNEELAVTTVTQCIGQEFKGIVHFLKDMRDIPK